MNYEFTTMANEPLIWGHFLRKLSDFGSASLIRSRLWTAKMTYDIRNTLLPKPGWGINGDEKYFGKFPTYHWVAATQICTI